MTSHIAHNAACVGYQRDASVWRWTRPQRTCCVASRILSDRGVSVGSRTAYYVKRRSRKQTRRL